MVMVADITSSNSACSDIVLTQDQMLCVNFKSDKTQLVVRGAAGSGKSTVLMSRAEKLMKECEPNTGNNVLILTFTNSLVKYAKEFFDSQDHREKLIKICTLDSYVSEISKTMRDRFDYPRGSIISNDNKKAIIESLLKRHANSKHRFYNVKNKGIDSVIQFWIEEFNWMLGHGITPDDEEKYFEIERKGRGTTYRMGTNDRLEAFSLFSEYFDIIHKNKNIERAEYYIFLNKHKSEIPDEFKFNHVLVDEAQDLPIIAMHLAISLSKKTVLIAMDANQRLYVHNWQMKDLGIQTTSRYLKKSFRCTKQIDDFAEALRQINEKYLDLDDVCKHITPSIEGPKPLIIGYPDSETEYRAIIDIVRGMLNNDKITIGIILRRKKEVYAWSEKLASQSIYHDVIIGGYNDWRNDNNSNYEYSIRSPGLKVCTINSAKGLEFHNVIIPHFTRNRYPPTKHNSGISEDELKIKYRNLAYVAMTRAKWRLVISFTGCPSEYLDEIYDSTDEGNGDYSKTLFDYTEFGETTDDTTCPLYYEFTSNNMPRLSVSEQQKSDIVDSNVQDDWGSPSALNSFKLYLRRAENGIADAMYQVATYYNLGIGTPQNYELAMMWYIKGSEAGDPNCKLVYGEELIKGEHIEKNIDLGMSLLKDAGTYGNSEAYKKLGDIYADGIIVPYDAKSAIDWYTCAADMGCIDSKTRLMKIYRDGMPGITPDRDEYLRWLKSASCDRDPESQYEYACYLYDEGEKDLAINYLIEAADAGYPYAQLKLHYIYGDKNNLYHDSKLSNLWLKKAIKQECPEAEYRMYEILKNDATHEAISYLHKSANHGYDVAKKELDRSTLQNKTSPDMILPNDDSLNNVISELVNHGFTIIDRRPMKGTVWIIDSPGVKEFISKNEKTFKFKYVKRGSRPTDYKSAWYL